MTKEMDMPITLFKGDTVLLIENDRGFEAATTVASTEFSLPKKQLIVDLKGKIGLITSDYDALIAGLEKEGWAHYMDAYLPLTH